MNKNWLLVFFLLTILYSCSNAEKERRSTDSIQKPETRSKIAVRKLDSIPWTAEYNDKTQKLEMQQNRSGFTGLQEDAILNVLNKKYPEIKLEAKGFKGDTLVVAIKNAFYLTQAMGTTGADTYLAEATYSLTEIPSVKAVKFEFEEGDHAIPGVYTRESFSDFR